MKTRIAVRAKIQNRENRSATAPFQLLKSGKNLFFRSRVSSDAFLSGKTANLICSSCRWIKAQMLERIKFCIVVLMSTLGFLTWHKMQTLYNGSRNTHLWEGVDASFSKMGKLKICSFPVSGWNILLTTNGVSPRIFFSATPSGSRGWFIHSS